MELRSFLELNESMALRAVLDAMQAVEAAWDDSAARARAMGRLFEVLDWALAHRFEAVRQLSSLASRVPGHPTYHQFMSLVAPIERAYGRGVTDGDFLVKTDDLPAPRAELLPLVLVVDNLRSAFNVGSIFRTAECFGVSKVHLCGYTARPDQEKLKKAAMGTEGMVHWSWHARAEDCVRDLKSQGYQVFALETSSEASSLTEFPFAKSKTGLVFGNERFGVEASLLKICDGVLEIPCQGQKNSLNVALSVGIAAYEWRKQYLAPVK